jgi:hypothetical protein
VDVDPSLLVHNHLAEAIVNAVATHRPSLVLVGQRHEGAHPVLGGAGDAVAGTVPTPVGVLIGDAPRLSEVVLLETVAGAGEGDAVLASELAARVGRKGLVRRQSATHHELPVLDAGQLWILPGSFQAAVARATLPEGAAVLLVFDHAEAARHAERYGVTP